MTPLRAVPCEDIYDLAYPVLASPKLRGVRCLIIDQVPKLAGARDVPNLVIREVLSGLPAMDGVIVACPPSDPGAAEITLDIVMDTLGYPSFKYHVFDALTKGVFGFSQRLEMARSYARASGQCVEFLEHKLIKTPEGLLSYRDKYEKLGYPGIMLRDPSSLYDVGALLELRNEQGV